MVVYLLDTDWMIDLLNGAPGVEGEVRRLSEEDAGISVVTLGELCDGAFGDADAELRIAAIEEIITELKVWPIDGLVAIEFGRERQRLRSQGNLIPDMDLLIAATAIAHNMNLVTRNLRHFDRIVGLNIYLSGEEA